MTRRFLRWPTDPSCAGIWREAAQPTILRFKRKMPRRRGRWITGYWLPAYAFLHFDLALDRWQQVRRAPGALGFVGDPPQPISEANYMDLIARCPAELNGNDEFTVIPCGSEIEVIDGPLKGTTGIVATSRGKSVWCEMWMFGKPSRVELRTRDVRIIR